MTTIHISNYKATAQTTNISISKCYRDSVSDQLISIGACQHKLRSSFAFVKVDTADLHLRLSQRIVITLPGIPVNTISI